MNKKGFVFIEMIITTVVLLISLLVLYNTYSNVIQDEKRRLYFDDISYVYKTETIRDIIVGTIDYSKFYNQYNSSRNGYVFLFNYGSKVWLSEENTLLKETLDNYNAKRLMYIKISDIRKIKQCFNEKGDYAPSAAESDEKKKCEATKTFISTYGKENLKEYLRTIDVYYDGAEYAGHDAILVVLYAERKNGTKSETDSASGGKTTMSYDKCIQHYVFKDDEDKGSASKCKDTMTPDELEKCQKELLNKYNANDKISYDMQCENAYHVAWVYF